MIEAFVTALKEKDEDRMMKMLPGLHFLRDTNEKKYASLEAVLDRLRRYAGCKDYKASPYLSYHIVEIDERFQMKVKSDTTGITQIYIRNLEVAPRRIRVDLSYDGSRYHGFQRQPKVSPTVQSTIEKVLRHLCGDKTPIVAAGRTDRGVHAFHQVIHFDTGSPLEDQKLEETMEKMLPADIRILKVTTVPPVFHARFDVTGKTYMYRIIHEKDPFLSHYALYEPELEESALEKILAVVQGSHDFIGFSKFDADKSTVRTVDKIDVFSEKRETRIEIRAHGFLRHMVRIIVGNAIRDVKRNTQFTEKALEEASKDSIKYMAPAEGLYLKRIDY